MRRPAPHGSEGGRRSSIAGAGSSFAALTAGVGAGASPGAAVGSTTRVDQRTSPAGETSSRTCCHGAGVACLGIRPGEATGNGAFKLAGWFGIACVFGGSSWSGIVRSPAGGSIIMVRSSGCGAPAVSGGFVGEALGACGSITSVPVRGFCLGGFMSLDPGSNGSSSGGSRVGIFSATLTQNRLRSSATHGFEAAHTDCGHTFLRAVVEEPRRFQ